MNSTPSPATGWFWKWGVCGLLLLATMINYMDRQTLNQTAKKIKVRFAEDRNTLYARLETGFGLAFAAGSVVSGLTVDRIGVRLFYPLMVFLWSAAGFATGFVRNYEELLTCRVLLGLFEGANWPCALYTTQRILAPAQRTMGNGILQSGAALGAIFTPQLVLPFLDDHSDRWRYPFMIVGALGLLWMILWLATIRPGAIPATASTPQPAAGSSMWAVYTDRRFLVLAFVVVAINATWHFFRVWLPLLLEEHKGYGKEEIAHFTSAYYIATDAGSIAAGFLTLALVRRGFLLHTSRMITYLVFASLVLLTFAAATLPRGWLLLTVLLIIGFGSLGVFPTYYSFSQELSAKHQGKVSGSLGCICWLAMAGLRALEGWMTENIGYTTSIAIAGLPPLLAFLVLLIFWKSPAPAAVPEVAQPIALPEPAPTAS